MQGLVLSSFFYGYIGTQLLGGWLGARYGGATVYGIGVFSTALLTLVTPLFANISVYLLIFLRIIEGLFEVTFLLTVTYDVRIYYVTKVYKMRLFLKYK